MRFDKVVVSAILLLAAITGAAFARETGDAPIVYSACYYGDAGLPAVGHAAARSAKRPVKPKDHAYFHLYRVDPDGRGRRQLTTADADDSEPRWSPDGRHILFVRELPGDMGGSLFVYAINADGTGEKRLYTNPAHQAFFEPRWRTDGEAICITRDDATLLEIAVRTGATKDIPAPVSARVLPIVRTDNDGATLLAAGKATEHPVRLRYDRDLQASIRAGQTDPDSFETFGFAPDHGPLLIRHPVGGSTEGHWYVYCAVNDRAGTIAPFAEGNSLEWSPDGQRFVTTAGRSLAPDSASDDGGMVWVSPLLLGTLHGGAATTRPIVNGAVYVTDCDWRPAAH